MAIKTLKPRVSSLGSQVRKAPTPSDQRISGRRLQDRRLRAWSKNPYCARCGELTDLAQGTARPFELDHIVALVNGGADTEDNIHVLCVGCHESKTRQDMAGMAVSAR